MVVSCCSLCGSLRYGTLREDLVPSQVTHTPLEPSLGKTTKRRAIQLSKQKHQTGKQWLARHDPEHESENQKRKRKLREFLQEPLRSRARHRDMKAWSRIEAAIEAKTAARKVTEAQILAAQTPQGWNRAQLAQWGVPWPLPKGWKTALLVGLPMPKP